jgi:hypothetical protein
MSSMELMDESGPREDVREPNVKVDGARTVPATFFDSIGGRPSVGGGPSGFIGIIPDLDLAGRNGRIMGGEFSNMGAGGDNVLLWLERVLGADANAAGGEAFGESLGNIELSVGQGAIC